MIRKQEKEGGYIMRSRREENERETEKEHIEKRKRKDMQRCVIVFKLVDVLCILYNWLCYLVFFFSFSVEVFPHHHPVKATLKGSFFLDISNSIAVKATLKGSFFLDISNSIEKLWSNYR